MIMNSHFLCVGRWNLDHLGILSKDMHTSLTLDRDHDTFSLWFGVTCKGNDMITVAWRDYCGNDYWDEP